MKNRLIESSLWVACGGAALLLLMMGLWEMFTVIGGAHMVDHTRRGLSLIFFGSVVSLAAAAWAVISRRPLWITLSLVAPVVVVNGLGAIDTGILPQLGAVIAIPVALAGLIVGRPLAGKR